MSPLVQVQNLCKQFEEGRRMVLNNLNADFWPGELAIILGKSGSGKSTLLNLISGIEKPTDGDVIVGGLTINRLSERKRTLYRRDHIGFVYQFFNLIPTLTVLENVTLPLELAGQDGQSTRERAVALLETVELADRLDTFPDKLSGGEQQRVAICRALVHDPLLVLADEPTGNLDEETGNLVLSLLLDLVKSSGKTLIMATHSLDSVALADRVYTIHDGRLTVEPKGKNVDGDLFQSLMAASGGERVEGGEPTHGTG